MTEIELGLKILAYTAHGPLYWSTQRVFDYSEVCIKSSIMKRTPFLHSQYVFDNGLQSLNAQAISEMMQ